MLELKNLTVKRGDLTVADHINVRFEEGKVYTVLGPNGTGKSSMLKTIFGELPHEGMITYQGKQLERTKLADWRKPIGYMPQDSRVDASLTALRLGEDRAASLGINLQVLRIKVLVLVAMMTATAISFVGVIGFIGLVAPHVARMLLGEDQRFFLPGAMLVGAAFLSLSSVLSKVIIPGALFPVGIVTSFIGVPFFFWIILNNKRGQ